MIVETRAELQVMLVAIACAVAAGIAIMTFLKWYAVRKASHWLPVPGRIITSAVERRSVITSHDSDARELRNFPAVTFEYAVGGRKLRGSRYSLMDNVGNVSVAETLKRYPVGRAVTVFYDPVDPSNSVIERTLPDGAVKTMLSLSGGLVLAALVLVFGITGLYDAVAPRLAHPGQAPIAMFLFLAGMVIWRMAHLMRAQARAARQWPKAQGKILVSGAEPVKLHKDSDGNSALSHRLFRARVTYEYRVSGNSYVGERVAFGAATMANWPQLIWHRAAKYAPGSPVTVFYDPNNAAEAVLEPRVSGQWLLWLSAGACFAVVVAVLANML